MIALLEHLKLTAQGAKVCASKLISELSAATLDAMQEMERAKADRISSVSIAIPPTGWVSDSTWPNYPLRCDITVKEVKSDDYVSITLSPNSLAAAAKCGLCQTCATQNGKISLWAQTAPTEVLNASYLISQGEQKPKEG